MQIDSNWNLQNYAIAKLHKGPLLIANIVKGTASSLRQFLATVSPWKMMENAF